MATISLTLPTSGTTITAGLHSTNYATIQNTINGGIDNNNFASGRIFDPTKLMQNGATTGQVLAWNGSNWAPAAGGMVQLFDSTLSVDSANFDITSISGSYSHLKMSVYARGDTAASTIFLLARFNNDSATNYDHQNLTGSGATASAQESFANSGCIVGNIPAASAAANLFGETEIWIPHYAGTSNNKAVSSQWSNKAGTSTGNIASGTNAEFWRSNSAITRVTILASAGNLKAGSRCTLYGMY